MSAPDVSLILRSIDSRLENLQRTVAKKADQDDLEKLEFRVRSSEQGLLRVYTIGGGLSALLGALFAGWDKLKGLFS